MGGQAFLGLPSIVYGRTKFQRNLDVLVLMQNGEIRRNGITVKELGTSIGLIVSLKTTKIIEARLFSNKVLMQVVDPEGDGFTEVLLSFPSTNGLERIKKISFHTNRCVVRNFVTGRAVVSKFFQFTGNPISLFFDETISYFSVSTPTGERISVGEEREVTQELLEAARRRSTSGSLQRDSQQTSIIGRNVTRNTSQGSNDRNSQSPNTRRSLSTNNNVGGSDLSPVYRRNRIGTPENQLASVPPPRVVQNGRYPIAPPRLPPQQRNPINPPSRITNPLGLYSSLHRNRIGNRERSPIPVLRTNFIPLSERSSSQNDIFIDDSRVHFTKIKDLREGQGNYKVCAIVKTYYVGRRYNYFMSGELFDDISRPKETMSFFIAKSSFGGLPKIKKVGQVVVMEGCKVEKFNDSLQIYPQDSSKIEVFNVPLCEYTGSDFQGKDSHFVPIPQWRMFSQSNDFEDEDEEEDEDEDSRPRTIGEILTMTTEEQVYVRQLQKDSMNFFSNPRSLFDFTCGNLVRRLPIYSNNFENIIGSDNENHQISCPMRNFVRQNFDFDPRKPDQIFQRPRPEPVRKDSNNHNYWDYIGKVIMMSSTSHENKNWHLVLWDGSVPPVKLAHNRRSEDFDMPIPYKLTAKHLPNEQNRFFSSPIYLSDEHKNNIQCNLPRSTVEVRFRYSFYRNREERMNSNGRGDNQSNNEGNGNGNVSERRTDAGEKSIITSLLYVNNHVKVGDWIVIRNIFYDWNTCTLSFVSNSRIMGLSDYDYRVVRKVRRVRIGYLYIRSDPFIGLPQGIPKEDHFEGRRVLTIPEVRNLELNRSFQKHVILTRGSVVRYYPNDIRRFCRPLCLCVRGGNIMDFLENTWRCERCKRRIDENDEDEDEDDDEEEEEDDEYDEYDDLEDLIEEDEDEDEEEDEEEGFSSQRSRKRKKKKKKRRKKNKRSIPETDRQWRYYFQMEMEEPFITGNTGNNSNKLVVTVRGGGNLFFGFPACNLYHPQNENFLIRIRTKMEMLVESIQRFRVRVKVSMENSTNVMYNLEGTVVVCETESLKV